MKIKRQKSVKEFNYEGILFVRRMRVRVLNTSRNGIITKIKFTNAGTIPGIRVLHDGEKYGKWYSVNSIRPISALEQLAEIEKSPDID